MDSGSKRKRPYSPPELRQLSPEAARAVKTRRHPRFNLEADVVLRSKSAGIIPGRTVDISESGMAAVLPVELPIAELFEFNVKLPRGTVTLQGVVRYRSAFRHGFEFLKPSQDLIDDCVRSLSQHE
jgi:hypothetical protein